MVKFSLPLGDKKQKKRITLKRLGRLERDNEGRLFLVNGQGEKFETSEDDIVFALWQMCDNKRTAREILDYMKSLGEMPKDVKKEMIDILRFLENANLMERVLKEPEGESES